MRCSKCKSQSLYYDKYTESYYCMKCKEYEAGSVVDEERYNYNVTRKLTQNQKWELDLVLWKNWKDIQNIKVNVK